MIDRVFFPLFVVLFVGGGLVGFVNSERVADPPDDVQDRLRIRLEAARAGSTSAMSVGTEQVQIAAGVRRYYRNVAYEPAWTGPDGPTGPARSLLAALRRADRQGLRPSDYHVAKIDTLRARLRSAVAAGEPMDPRVLADFELLCTDAFLLYGAHLLGGRVDPVKVVPTWNLDRRQRNLVEHLQDALETASVQEALAQLKPPQAEYGALQGALRRYRALKRVGGWPQIPDGPTLKEGIVDERVAILRRRLEMIGDVPDTTVADTTTFGPALHEAVSHFQERHGLSADGIVGPATRSALNVPVADRITQIRVNMERWRWLPQDLGNPHVLVNIADFWLRVVEEGRTVQEMRVVVGRPFRQTPVFSDEISYLVFSPYWHVPRSIATQDKLPAFKQNPGMVSKLGYEVLEGWGTDARTVDPSTINWAQFSASSFPYRLRQKPGPQNALGQVKFMFPNAHDVYLHDTPTRGHFSEAERSFSSGCIRVERPVDLATILLTANDGWTTERIEKLMTQESEHTVVLKRKVPVHLQYWTAWAEEGERIHFRKDIYDRDGAVASALNAPPSPSSNRSTSPERDEPSGS